MERLRKAADSIDDARSPYLCVVSVLMLREGWDVRNVSTIVGLRPYRAESNILPEQTLGRGLRKMFSLDVQEKLVVVVGTVAPGDIRKYYREQMGALVYGAMTKLR